MSVLEAEPLKMKQLIERSNKVFLDLAYISRVPEGTWQNWAKGKHTPRIKPYQLPGIIKALGCTQEEFFEACREIDNALNK